MRVTLTNEHHLMLELIADKPLPAIPEIARHTSVLAAAHLIELTAESRWTLTRLPALSRRPIDVSVRNLAHASALPSIVRHRLWMLRPA